MKLYATTTSERATKGQGGQKFLDIDIQAGDERAHLLRLTVEYEEGKTDKNGARVSFVSADNTAILYNLREKTAEAIEAAIEDSRKGEKKKSEAVHTHSNFGIGTGCTCE
jgi:hypothetical protein